MVEVDPAGSEMPKKEVLVKMRKDEIGDCAKEDFLIKKSW